MKRTNPLWGSISILIGVVIAILALLRGVWATALLENLIADLRSRSHSSLTLNEDGSICIQPVDGGKEIAKDVFATFPEKVYWPRLAKVLEQEGLAADVQDTKILVSW